MDDTPFEGVHFYSAEELGVVLSGFANSYSNTTGQFIVDKTFAENLALISMANAKAYAKAHGTPKTPHTADRVIAALPSKPHPFWYGQLCEFDRGLRFNLLGYDHPGQITEEDIATMGRETWAATSFIWFAVRDHHQGPS